MACGADNPGVPLPPLVCRAGLKLRPSAKPSFGWRLDDPSSLVTVEEPTYHDMLIEADGKVIAV